MTRCQKRDLRTTFISIPSLARGVEEDTADSRLIAGEVQADFWDGIEEETAREI